MTQKLTMKVLSEELDVLRSRVRDLELDMERKLEGVLEKTAESLEAYITASGGVSPGGPVAGPGVGVDERRRLIAEAAYMRAERRGFSGGSPDQDWLEAELEVDWMLLHGWVKHQSSPEEKRSRP